LVLFDERLEGFAFHQGLHLFHFGGAEGGSNGAHDIARHFPLFLVSEESLFDLIALANVRGGAGVTGGYAGIGVHGQREITMDQVDLASVDVIVHDLLRGGGEKLLASGALEVAVNLHDEGSALGAERLGGVDVVHAVDGNAGLGRGWSSLCYHDHGGNHRESYRRSRRWPGSFSWPGLRSELPLFHQLSWRFPRLMDRRKQQDSHHDQSHTQ